MFYLIIALLNSVALAVVFKLFKKYQVDTFQCIVYNYFVCVITGTLFLGEIPMGADIVAAPWFPYTLILAVLFMTAFYAAAMTVGYFGMAIATVVQRMSLAISVPFAILVMGETASVAKVIGIGLALASVILTNIPQKNQQESLSAANAKPKYAWILPIFICLCSGTIECMLQYVQGNFLPTEGKENAIFTIYLFLMTSLAGFVWLAGLLLSGKLRWAWKNIIGGIALGIPNYFSIFFLLKSFESIEQSTALPINNIGVVVITAVLGILLFRERLSAVNWLGLLLAVLAITLIAI